MVRKGNASPSSRRGTDSPTSSPARAPIKIKITRRRRRQKKEQEDSCSDDGVSDSDCSEDLRRSFPSLPELSPKPQLSPKKPKIKKAVVVVPIVVPSVVVVQSIARRKIGQTRTTRDLVSQLPWNDTKRLNFRRAYTRGWAGDSPAERQRLNDAASTIKRWWRFSRGDAKIWSRFKFRKMRHSSHASMACEIDRLKANHLRETKLDKLRWERQTETLVSSAVNFDEEWQQQLDCRASLKEAARKSPRELAAKIGRRDKQEAWVVLQEMLAELDARQELLSLVEEDPVVLLLEESDEEEVPAAASGSSLRAFLDGAVDADGLYHDPALQKSFSRVYTLGPPESHSDDVDEERTDVKMRDDAVLAMRAQTSFPTTIKLVLATLAASWDAKPRRWHEVIGLLFRQGLINIQLDNNGDPQELWF